MTIKRKVSKKSGFTLIEMIGVLAIIAILTALLIPRIFQVMKDAQISSALTAYNSAKSATTAHYGKWTKFGLSDGTDLAVNGSPLAAGDVYEDWDEQLRLGEYVEQRFALKIGNGQVGSLTDPAGSRLRVINIRNLTTASPVALANGTYNLTSLAYPTGYDPLAGTDPVSTQNEVTGTFLVEAVVPGVALKDALVLANRIDGADLRPADLAQPKLLGRVKWGVPGGDLVTLHIYVAHR